MINIILFGPPGSGKGTQSEKIIDKYGLNHLSTGDLFRININNKTALGLKAKSFMDNGNLVPDEVVINMLKEAVLSQKSGKGFIFDGFPRTITQAETLESFLSDNGMPLNRLISLEVESKELISRLQERGKTSGRVDDQDMNKIQNRLEVYHKETHPVKQYFSKKNLLTSIQGEGSINDIFNDISSTIDNLK